jgi:hypothetical protein
LKKVNIALKDRVHLQAKIIAVVKGINLSEFLEKAIEDAIRKDKKLIETLTDCDKPSLEKTEKGDEHEK